MLKRNLLFFVNPISGTGNYKAMVEYINQTLKMYQHTYSIEHTQESGNYNYLPEKIKKEQITDVVICGGDGSINQIATYLIGNPVRIGIIPRGSGNGLAFSAGIPKNIKRAMAIILDGQASFIDAFQVNNRYSFMLCGLGFDAKIAHEFANVSSRGLKTYTRLTVKHWILAKSYPFSLFTEGEALAFNAYFISIANANQFGNNMRIAPKASLSDGLLDIVVVNKTNRILLLGKVLLQITRGKPIPVADIRKKNRTIHYFRAATLTLKNNSLAPLHIDGEPAETEREFNIRIIPHAINLIQPMG